MGWERGQGSGLIFKVTCGVFRRRQGEEVIEESAYTGYLRDIKRYTDEYHGEEGDKIEITLSDGAENVKIQFTLDGWFAITFFQRIRNADLGEKITLGVMPSDTNEKMSFCWMKQAGKKIEKDTAFPQVEKVTVGRKQHDDWTAFEKAADTEIARILKAIGKQN